jgi:hypothetical protein
MPLCARAGEASSSKADKTDPNLLKVNMLSPGKLDCDIMLNIRPTGLSGQDMTVVPDIDS